MCLVLGQVAEVLDLNVSMTFSAVSRSSAVTPSPSITTLIVRVGGGRALLRRRTLTVFRVVTSELGDEMEPRDGAHGITGGRQS